MEELAPAELARAAARYGLNAHEHRRIDGGMVNASYRLATSDGPYILTVLHKRGMDGAEALGRYLHALRCAGFPVPAPRPTVEAKWATTVGDKPVLVSRFVEGETNRRLTERELSEVGAVLGRLHASDVLCELQPCLRLTAADLAGAASFADRRFADWLLRRHEEVRPVLARGLPVGPTHGDPFPDNLITRSDGELVLIDWEDAANDILLLDLGMAIVGLCSNERVVPSRVDAFLRGYRFNRAVDGDAGDLVDATVYVGLLAVHNRYVKGRRSFAHLAAVVNSVPDGLARI